MESNFMMGLSVCIWSFICWKLLNVVVLRLLCLTPLKLKKDEVVVPIVAAIHGILASAVGLTVMFICSKDVIKATYEPLYFYSWISLAYFIYDIQAMYSSYCVQMNTEQSCFLQFFHSNRMMVLHHSFMAFIFTPIAIYRAGVGDFFVGCFYCLELSAFFTNFRSILSKCGYKNTRLYTVNGVVMVVTFTCCRVLIFPLMYWCYGVQYCAAYPSTSYFPSLTSPIVAAVKTVPTHCTLGCIVILLPQLYWLSLMLRTCLSMLTTAHSSNDKNK